MIKIKQIFICRIIKQTGLTPKAQVLFIHSFCFVFYAHIILTYIFEKF